MTITKYDANEAGCLIEGAWGQYGVARMVLFAHRHGYDNEEIFGLAVRHLNDSASMGPKWTSIAFFPLSDEEQEKLSDAAVDVETWMNENIAPEGYQFGWNDGEFYLQEDFWWDTDFLDEDDESDEYIPETNGWEDADLFDQYDKEYDL